MCSAELGTEKNFPLGAWDCQFAVQQKQHRVEFKNRGSLSVPLIYLSIFPCKVWCFSSSLVTSIHGQTFSLKTVVFCVCPCPPMPFPVWLLLLTLPLLLRLPISTLQQTHSLDIVLHPSHIAGLGLDSHLFSKCFLEDGWGFSFLQWAWMVKEPLMLAYKHSQSAARLPLIKKLHWLPCSTILSNWWWFLYPSNRSLAVPR